MNSKVIAKPLDFFSTLCVAGVEFVQANPRLCNRAQHTPHWLHQTHIPVPGHMQGPHGLLVCVSWPVTRKGSVPWPIWHKRHIRFPHMPSPTKTPTTTLPWTKWSSQHQMCKGMFVDSPIRHHLKKRPVLLFWERSRLGWHVNGIYTFFSFSLCLSFIFSVCTFCQYAMTSFRSATTVYSKAVQSATWIPGDRSRPIQLPPLPSPKQESFGWLWNLRPSPTAAPIKAKWWSAQVGDVPLTGY